MKIDNPIVSGSLIVSGSTTVTGVLSASFISGDGSGLTGVTSYTDADTLSYINSIGVVSGSVNWDTLIGKPSGIVSSSAQLSTEISGAFTSTSASLASRTTTLENAGYTTYSDSDTLTYINSIGVVSSSAQITITESQISDLSHYTDSDTLSYINTIGVVSSSAQLSNTTIPGNLTVGGKLTAQEFHTEFVSASILYESGSTQFGDTVDDTHTFIGTLSATTIQNVISSSAQVDYNSIPNRVTNNNQLTNGAGYTTCTGDITGVTAGTGISGGGTSGTVTVSHADTSTLTGAQGSAGIASITVDALGHVTAVTTATYCTTDTNTTYTANDMLTCVKTVDGAGSGLDADLLDGNQASAFYLASNPSGYTTCTGTLTGTGTSGYISKWNGSTSQTNSVIYDNGTNVGINSTSPTQTLDVRGRLTISPTGTTPDNSYNGNLVITKPTNSGQYINLIRSGQYGWSIGYLYNTNNFAIGTITVNDSDFTSPPFVITNSKNVGIGTSSPSQKLEVAGNVLVTTSGSTQPLKTFEATYKQFSVDYPSSPSIYTTELNFGLYGRLQYNGNGGIFSIENRSTQAGSSNMRFVMGTTERMRIASDGNVGIGTTSPSTKLEVNGTATVTTIVETSALRFKENINTIEDTSIVDKLRPVSFDWKDSKETEYGFIAEEVYHLDTTLVTKSGEDELQGVKYTKLIPLLVKKVQEQDKQIKELEYKLDTLSTCIK